jgi:hypothetical protein
MGMKIAKNNQTNKQSNKTIHQTTVPIFTSGVGLFKIAQKQEILKRICR